MLESVQDNRNFYRIEDRAGLEFCLTDEATVNDESADFPIPVSAHFQLLNQLLTIDSENSQLLRSISEKDRNIASYIKGIDQKIELLAQMLVGCDDTLKDEHLKTITLSEGGLSFHHYESIETDRYVAVKLTLIPSCLGMLLYGRVIETSFDDNGNHLIHINFTNITENNRALIARHVLLFQAKQRRENNSQSQ